jgi:hypothetical protein
MKTLSYKQRLVLRVNSISSKSSEYYPYGKLKMYQALNRSNMK